MTRLVPLYPVDLIASAAFSLASGDALFPERDSQPETNGPEIGGHTRTRAGNDHRHHLLATCISSFKNVFLLSFVECDSLNMYGTRQ